MYSLNAVMERLLVDFNADSRPVGCEQLRSRGLFCASGEEEGQLGEQITGQRYMVRPCSLGIRYDPAVDGREIC